MHRKESLNRRAVIAFIVIAVVVICIRVLPALAGRDPVIYGMESVVLHWDGRSYFYPQEAYLRRGYYTVSIEYDTSYALNCEVHMEHDSARHYVYVDDPVEIPEGRGVREFSLLMREEMPIRLVLAEKAESEAFTEASFVFRFTYRPAKTAAYELFLAAEVLLLALAALLFIMRFRRTQDNAERQVMFGLAILILLINIPTFVDYLPYGHDQPMHLTRIEHLAEGLRNGIFPVKMHPGWYHGYGNPIGVGYADTFLYPFALLHMLAVPLWKCYQVYERVFNTALILIAYFSFRIIARGHRRIALTGTALYGLGVYYIVDLYIRGALGEATAMVFLPLVAAGFYALMTDEARTGIVCLVAGYTGLLQSHNITTMATAFFSAFFCILQWKKMIQKERLLPLIKAAAVTAVINLGFLVPMLDYYSRYEFRTKAWYSTHMQGVGTTVSQLMMTSYDPVSDRMNAGVQGRMPLTVGWAMLIVFFAALYFLMKKQEGRRKNAVATVTLLSALALWMSTSSFPYHWLDLHVHFIYQLTGETFHMPWRYLTIAALLLSVLCVLLLTALAREGSIQKSLLLGACCALMFVSAFQGVRLMSLWMYETYPCRQLEQGGTVGENLFIPKEVDLDGMVYAPTVLATGASVDRVERRGTTFRVSASNPFAEEGYLDFPLWGFYGYRAYDMQGTQLAIDEDVFTSVRVLLPAGYSGEITVAFREPVLWRVAETAAVAALGLFIAWLIISRKKAGYKQTVDATIL